MGPVVRPGILGFELPGRVGVVAAFDARIATILFFLATIILNPDERLDYAGPDDFAKFMAKSDADLGATMKAVGIVK